MEQLQRAVVAMLAGLACAGFGYAWLASATERGPGPGAIGRFTSSAAALRTQAPAIAVTQARTSRKATPPLPQLMVEFRGGLLTVRARGAPLGEVLAAITRSVGVAFNFSGDAGEPLSIDIGPRPEQEVISRLLDRASYGYAFVDTARGAGRQGLGEVFLVKQGTVGDGSGRAAAQAVPAPAAIPAPARPVEPASRPNAAALQKQRAVDALFDACRIQGCDTS